MTIVIRNVNNKFVAFVADATLTFVSGEHEKEFDPFRNGIVAEGQTWSEALDNIKSQINKYLQVHMVAMKKEPEFTKDGKATIITEDVIVEDFLK